MFEFFEAARRAQHIKHALNLFGHTLSQSGPQTSYPVIVQKRMFTGHGLCDDGFGWFSPMVGPGYLY